MTHNELLAKIQSDYEENKHFRDEPKWKPFAALLAVVELHEPYGDVQCSICENGQWPCSTIKTISEALA